MMKVDLGDGLVVGVSFRHTFPEKTDAYLWASILEFPFTLVCSGTSKRNKMDEWDRETGRKVALARALKGLKQKRDRAKVWEAYRARKGTKLVPLELQYGVQSLIEEFNLNENDARDVMLAVRKAVKNSHG